MTDELYNLTIHEARTLLDRRELSSVELAQSYLERIERLEPSVKAYVRVTPEQALKQAQQADALIAQRRGDASNRHTPPNQGQHVHQGSSNHLLVAHA